MNRHNMPLPRLLEMIERYFDCLLTDEEESRLRSVLATTTFTHPAIDEAKAIMGLLRPAREKKRQTSFLKHWHPIASVAAASVVIAVGALFLLRARSFHTVGDSTCIAYVNGTVVTDEAEVLRLLTADIREFGDGAREARLSIYEELDEAVPLIENYESTPITDAN